MGRRKLTFTEDALKRSPKEPWLGITGARCSDRQEGILLDSSMDLPSYEGVG